MPCRVRTATGDCGRHGHTPNGASTVDSRAADRVAMADPFGHDTPDVTVTQRSPDPRSTLEPVRQAWANRGVELSVAVMGDGCVAELGLIRVRDDLRGAGLARQAMDDLLSWADREGVTVALTPDGSFGASARRLRDFYASLGFQSNKGSGRDYRVTATMIRPHPDERPPEAPKTVMTADESAVALLAELDAKVADGRMSAEEADEIRSMF